MLSIFDGFRCRTMTTSYASSAATVSPTLLSEETSRPAS